jgi:MFS family permease
LRSFHVYLISAFIGDLMLPIFYIYLPLLGYELHASVLEVGLIGGASYATYSFMPFVMGRFSDRVGSRILFIILAFSILSIVSALYVVVQVPELLIVTRFFEGLGWAMLWPAIDAAISETGGEGAAKSLGIYNYVWSAAAAMGPLLGAVLVTEVSIRFAYVTTMSVLLLAAAINLGAVLSRPRGVRQSPTKVVLVDSESPISVQKETTRVVGATDEKTPPANVPLRSRLSYMLPSSIGSMTALVALTFFPPYARSMGLSFFLIGVATFAYGGGRFAMFLLTSRSSVRDKVLDKSNRFKKIFLALAIASSAALVFTLRNESGLVYILAFAVIGASYAFVITITQSVLITEIQPSKMGAGAGTFESSLGIGSAIGPSFAGLVSGGSLRVPFVVPSLFFLVSILMFVVISAKNPVRKLR